MGLERYPNTVQIADVHRIFISWINDETLLFLDTNGLFLNTRWWRRPDLWSKEKKGI